MKIDVKNIDAHPFKNFELFCEQIEERKNLIKNLVLDYDVVKMVFNNKDYIIIGSGFKNNVTYQRTYFTLKDEPLSHMEYEHLKELLKDNYITEDLEYIEVI